MRILLGVSRSLSSPSPSARRLIFGDFELFDWLCCVSAVIHEPYAGQTVSRCSLSAHNVYNSRRTCVHEVLDIFDQNPYHHDRCSRWQFPLGTKLIKRPSSTWSVKKVKRGNHNIPFLHTKYSIAGIQISTKNDVSYIPSLDLSRISIYTHGVRTVFHTLVSIAT
jgi:hypothetical protein